MTGPTTPPGEIVKNDPITQLQRAARQLTDRVARLESAQGPRAVHTSESIGKLTLALAKASLGFEAVMKEREGNIQGKEGRQGYSYKYASLDAVIAATRRPLAENELAFLQLPKLWDRGVVIVSLLSHSSGEWIEDELPMIVNSPDPKALGSAISYGRRYAMCSMLNISPTDEEDDDGDGAGPSRGRPPTRERRATEAKGPSADDVDRAFAAGDGQALGKMLTSEEAKVWRGEYRTRYADMHANSVELRPLDNLTKRARALESPSRAWSCIIDLADAHARAAIKARIQGGA